MSFLSVPKCLWPLGKSVGLSLTPPFEVLPHIWTSLLSMLGPCFRVQVVPSFTFSPALETCRHLRPLPHLHSQTIIPGPPTLAPQLLLINLFLLFPFNITLVQTLFASPLSHNRNHLVGLLPSDPAFASCSLHLGSTFIAPGTLCLYDLEIFKAPSLPGFLSRSTVSGLRTC